MVNARKISFALMMLFCTISTILGIYVWIEKKNVYTIVMGGISLGTMWLAIYNRRLHSKSEKNIQ